MTATHETEIAEMAKETMNAAMVTAFDKPLATEKALALTNVEARAICHTDDLLRRDKQ